jgi:ribonuclease HI
MRHLQGEQLLIFSTVPSQGDEPVKNIENKEIIATQCIKWDLFIDGAARRNPGPAGAGIYILKDGMPFFQEGYYLGELTNNQAEYTSLLLGLYHIEQWKTAGDELAIFSDSQLLVRQIQGIYRVRNADLGLKHRVAQHWVRALQALIYHIPRESNSHADAMANKGIDLKKAVPAQFNSRLRSYEALVG